MKTLINFLKELLQSSGTYPNPDELEVESVEQAINILENNILFDWKTVENSPPLETFYLVCDADAGITEKALFFNGEWHLNAKNRIIDFNITHWTYIPSIEQIKK